MEARPEGASVEGRQEVRPDDRALAVQGRPAVRPDGKASVVEAH